MQIPEESSLRAEALRLGLVTEPTAKLSRAQRAQAAQSLLDAERQELAASRQPAPQPTDEPTLNLISRTVTATPAGEIMVEVWLNPKEK